MVSTSAGMATVSFLSNHKCFSLLTFSCLLPSSLSFLSGSLPGTSHLTSPNTQIKPFLEDSTDDPELSKFMKDFPGSESCHPPEAKTRMSRPQIPESRPQAPDLYEDDLALRPPSWPQASDSQQYFCTPTPLSPSTRPRSPWGKLDPYDSSEVERLLPCLCLSVGGYRKTQGGSRENFGVCVHTRAPMNVHLRLSILC